MRKYNSKTKRTILIIGLLFVIFIIIFSLFLKRAIDVSKTAYKISSGSVLFDYNNDKIVTTSDSTIKVKWGGNYYLKYNDKNYNLTKHSIVYNSTSGDLTLYGKFYEVKKTGKVSTLDDENVVNNSVNSRFFKLADRKYLIVDRIIQADKNGFVTSNYLIVNLDKSGNATLLNDKTSVKTIEATVLTTTSYKFDIANEILNFGGEDIDLKKIIGSTNKYDSSYDLNKNNSKDDDKDGTGTGSGGGNGSGDGTGSSGNGSGDGTGSSGNGSGESESGTGINANGTTAGTTSSFNNNYNSTISDLVVDKIVNATKNTSVIRVSPGIDKIIVDYVVYDPKNEYQSVWVEVENTNTSLTNTIYLSKNDTKIVINKLSPNIFYNLKFKYSYLDDGKLKEYTFDKTGVYTKLPNISISVPKIINNKLYYKISLDGFYTVTGGTINLLKNGKIVSSSSIPAVGNVNEIGGNNCYFDISKLGFVVNSNDLISLKVASLSFNTHTISPTTVYKFRY